MNLDLDAVRRALTQECELAIAHYCKHPTKKSRSESFMLLEGIYHGVEAVVLALQPGSDNPLREMARSLVQEYQERLRGLK